MPIRQSDMELLLAIIAEHETEFTMMRGAAQDIMDNCMAGRIDALSALANLAQIMLQHKLSPRAIEIPTRMREHIRHTKSQNARRLERYHLTKPSASPAATRRYQTEFQARPHTRAAPKSKSSPVLDLDLDLKPDTIIESHIDYHGPLPPTGDLAPDDPSQAIELDFDPDVPASAKWPKLKV